MVGSRGEEKNGGGGWARHGGKGVLGVLALACVAGFAVLGNVSSVLGGKAGTFLLEHGYDPSEYSVVLAWEERPIVGGARVSGYRLEGPDGGRFDRYTANGKLLGEEDLASFGVTEKDWAPQDRSMDARPVGAKALRAAPRTPRPLAPVEPDVRVSQTDLPPLDMRRIREEDAAGQSSPAKGVSRIGVHRELPSPLTVEGAASSRGGWAELADGRRVWSAAIHSPGAFGVRVEIKALELPAGAYLLVYNPFDDSEVHGPYDGLRPGEGSLWSPTIAGDEAVVECVLPPGARVEDVRIRITRVTHNYVSPDELAALKAGACNLDVGCYEAWHEASLGVAGLGVVGVTGNLFCTGFLLASEQRALEGALLVTANHCVPGSRGAGSLEAYWFFQRDGCDGSVPSLFNVPRSRNGADTLITSDRANGTDITLLRLRERAPAGASALGWSSADVGPDVPVTSIHHPSGSYKRIAFGTTQAEATIEPLDRYHEVIWHEGTTEPGSSGSPLLLGDTQQVIGQLFGGFASCSQPLAPDAYGRFDVAFPLLAPWLLGAEEEFAPEDVNADGEVNAVDIQLVINAALGIDISPYDGDVTGNGKVDAVDVQRVINAALGIGAG